MIRYADEKWRTEAACKGVVEKEGNYNSFFLHSFRGKKICLDCPVAYDCYLSSVENEEMDGVWGGLDPRERDLFIRKFPKVRSVESRYAHERHLGRLRSAENKRKRNV